MSKLIDALQSAATKMIINTANMAKISAEHIVKQKLGNNPIDKAVDENVYSECKIRNIDQLIICGFGKKNDKGIGPSREIDYASYVTKTAVVLQSIPLVRSNGPYSNATGELERFIHIWRRYYGSRSGHYGISINDKPVNPFTMVSARVTKDNKYVQFEMIIANARLSETEYEKKYYGDLMIFSSESLGFGSNYTRIDKYTEKSEDRTTISALTGRSPYGERFLEVVEKSFDTINFIEKEMTAVRPHLSIVKHLLLVNNYFKANESIPGDEM